MRFDSHTHLFAPGQILGRESIAMGDRTFREMYADPKAKMATARELLTAMAEADIERAVAAGFAFTHEPDLVEQNEYLCEVANKSEGRVTAVATINPGLFGWERVANHAIGLGARGLGELRPHNQGWDPLGPAGEALCNLARDARLVLLWHVSEPVGHAYAGKTGGISPVELIQLAARFPDVPMIAAHLGGGLSFYLQMPELKNAIGNVYFDTAAVTLLYDEGSVARLVALVGPDRVLFGSDYPLLSPRRQLERILGELPGDVTEDVCGGNAVKLFSDT